MKITMNTGNNPAYEAMFDDLIQSVFGFSFAPWFARKLWDKNYESYAIIEDGNMLSNVCIYKSDLLINGEKVSAIQFGAVATRPCARGRGLSRQIMEHVLALYSTRFAYLFANESVLDFYPPFGFKQVQTYGAEISVAIDNDPKAAVKCGLDDERLQAALQNKRMHSNIMDCVGSAPIQMFHYIMAYAKDIYYLPQCQAVVVATQKGDRLFVADVLSQRAITFEEIAAELPFCDVKKVAFGFSPDWLGITPTWTPTNMQTDPFFVRGSYPLPEKFCFPVTSMT